MRIDHEGDFAYIGGSVWGITLAPQPIEQTLVTETGERIVIPPDVKVFDAQFTPHGSLTTPTSFSEARSNVEALHSDLPDFIDALSEHSDDVPFIQGFTANDEMVRAASKYGFKKVVRKPDEPYHLIASTNEFVTIARRKIQRYRR